MSENVETIEVDGQQTFEGMPEPTEVVESELDLQTVIVELTKGMESYTPYAIHKIVNGVFAVYGVDKTIPPQMMYQYTKNGMIAGKESKGRKIFTRDEVQVFVYKYTNNKI